MAVMHVASVPSLPLKTAPVYLPFYLPRACMEYKIIYIEREVYIGQEVVFLAPSPSRTYGIECRIGSTRQLKAPMDCGQSFRRSSMARPCLHRPSTAARPSSTTSAGLLAAPRPHSRRRVTTGVSAGSSLAGDAARRGAQAASSYSASSSGRGASSSPERSSPEPQPQAAAAADSTVGSGHNSTLFSTGASPVWRLSDGGASSTSLPVGDGAAAPAPLRSTLGADTKLAGAEVGAHSDVALRLEDDLPGDLVITDSMADLTIRDDTDSGASLFPSRPPSPKRAPASRQWSSSSDDAGAADF